MKEFEARLDLCGQPHAAYVCEPAAEFGPNRPGVLVFHGGAGPSEHERERARRLAELGYVALAPDLFGQPFTSREQGIALISGLISDPARFRGLLVAALAALSLQPRVGRARLAAIGFCFGGLAALELARAGGEIAAAVSFHGGLSTHAPATENTVTASILVCAGAADPFIGAEQRAAFEAEMVRARADWQLCLYSNAQHGFTERTPAGGARPGCRYDERADRRSWSALTALFEETLA